MDPKDPNHPIAGQSDSGSASTTAASFSRSTAAGTGATSSRRSGSSSSRNGHTADAASDPALAMDEQGNAYFSCILFDVNAAANAVVVTKSSAQLGGTNIHVAANAHGAYIVWADTRPRVGTIPEEDVYFFAFVTRSTFGGVRRNEKASQRRRSARRLRPEIETNTEGLRFRVNRRPSAFT